MATTTVVQLPDGTRHETTLEAVIEQLADQVGKLTQTVTSQQAELTALREMAGARIHTGDTAQTGFYL